MSEVITIRLNIGRIIYVTGALALIILGLYIVYIDTSMTPRIVIPTDNPRSIHGFFKDSVAVSYVNLSSNSDTLSITRGVVYSIILDSMPTGYAIVILRGVSLYVLAVVIIAMLIYLFISRGITRRLNSRTLLAYGVFTLLTASSMVTLLFYIDTATAMGYTYRETPLVVGLGDLKPLDLDETGQSLIVNLTTGLVKLRYLYTLRDNIDSLSLIKVQLLLNDAAYPLIYINTSRGRVLLLGNSTTVFYTGAGSLTISVFSDQKLDNSVLLYHRISFYPSAVGEPSTILVASPLILLLLACVIGALLFRMTMQTVLSGKVMESASLEHPPPQSS